VWLVPARDGARAQGRELKQKRSLQQNKQGTKCYTVVEIFVSSCCM